MISGFSCQFSVPKALGIRFVNSHLAAVFVKLEFLNNILKFYFYIAL